jgi:cold-inducible RNA-binding protein
MAKKLYVGNLPYGVTDEQLGQMFAQYGQVSSAVVIKFKDTGRSKGFGFVEFDKDEEADKAAEEMNGKEIEGRNLVVNEARPMQPRQPQPMQ